MFWRIYYGFLRLTGLAQCFAGGYPCCCTTSGSTSSKPPPGSTSSAPQTVTCGGCSISKASPDLLVEISGTTNGSCSTCSDLDGAYGLYFDSGVSFLGGISGGRTWHFGSCNWDAWGGEFPSPYDPDIDGAIHPPACSVYNDMDLDWDTQYFIDGAAPHYRTNASTSIQVTIGGHGVTAMFILDNAAGACEPLWDCTGWSFTVPYFSRSGTLVCNLSTATVTVSAI
jgi:hypothetical protein